jgi:hypothetical protein
MSDASTDQPSGPAGGNSARLNSVVAAKALRQGFAWLAKPPYSLRIVEDGSTNDHNGFEYARMLFRNTHCDVCVSWHPLQSEFDMSVRVGVLPGTNGWPWGTSFYSLMVLDELPFRGLYVNDVEELSTLCEIASAALRRHTGLLSEECKEVARGILDRVRTILAEQTD